jgi:hypothetical protein
LLLDHDVQRQSGQKLKKKKEKIVFNEPNEWNLTPRDEVGP